MWLPTSWAFLKLLQPSNSRVLQAFLLNEPQFSFRGSASAQLPLDGSVALFSGFLQSLDVSLLLAGLAVPGRFQGLGWHQSTPPPSTHGQVGASLVI